MRVLLAFVMSASGGRVLAHPFDGDGSGPAKAGSTNVQAYLYVEPYTCRVECLLWLPTALEVFGMPQGDSLVLSPEVKEQLMQKARAEALTWCAVKVNGSDQPLDLTACTVLRGMPGNSDIIPPNEAVGVMDAMLGLTWECSAPPDIKQVELEWRKFTTQAPGVPVIVSYGPIFEHGMVLSATAPIGTWKNNGSLPPARALAKVPPLPPVPTVAVRLGSILWVLLIGGLIWSKRWLSPKTPRTAGLALAALALGAIALWPVLVIHVAAQWVKPETVNVPKAQEILQALLRNTYRAFDQRDESAVYDVLARSIHGDLLERLYVQTAKALALEAQDGTRAKVSDLAVDVDSVNPMPNSEGFVAHGQWTAFGRVGHWGHMHNRINKYKANMTVEPVNGEWKMTALEVLEEVRDFAKMPGQ
jgi:hypothetical protein